MRKITAVLGSALFFVVAPLLAAAIIPWWITRWEFRPAFFDVEATRVVGVMLILAGVPGVATHMRGLHCKDWARRRRSLRHSTLW